MLFQLVALAAGWVKRTAGKGMVGGHGACDPGDQGQFKRVRVRLLSPEGWELWEGRNKG